MDAEPSIIIRSEISGVAAENVTERVLQVDKIHEVGEISPLSYQYSDFAFMVDNMDGWYTGTYLPKFGTSGDVIYVYVMLGSVTLWVGYLEETPAVDHANFTVAFRFITLLKRSELIHVPFNDPYAHYVDSDIIHDGWELMKTSYTNGYIVELSEVYNPLSGVEVKIESHVGGFHPGQFPSGHTFNMHRVIKSLLGCFLGWAYFMNGKLHIASKNGVDAHGLVTLSNDEILDYRAILINEVQTKVDVTAYGKSITDPGFESATGTYTSSGDDALPRSLSADLDQIGHLDPRALDYYTPWMLHAEFRNLVAQRIHEYYAYRNKQGVVVTVDGLSHWIGHRYALPSPAGEYYEYISYELYRNLTDRTSEIFLTPRKP